MPFVYEVAPGANFTTNVTPNTETDALFVKPGTASTLAIIRGWMQGKGASLTTLNSILQRFKIWTSSASSGGSAITPQAKNPRSPAASSTAGQASGGVTPGTGGPSLVDAMGSTATGPGGFDTLGDLNRATTLAAAANTSGDLFNISGTASMAFETGLDVQEG